MVKGVAIGKIFQNTINFFSKKPNNAEIVSRPKQYAGEWSKELPYYRFYEYYHQTPSVKRNINSIHKRWMGSSMEVRSKSKVFDTLWQAWSETTNFEPKLKEFALDTLITGTGMIEKQYYQNLLSNAEHIPTRTLWRIFRDEFGQILSIWQMTDGDIKEHSPRTMALFTINNPERDAVGKSAMYAVAVPQKIAGKVDSLGNPINPERYLPSILDVKMRLNYAHMEIAEKQAKARWFVSLKNVKDKDRQKEIERDLENEESSRYITVTDSDVDTKSLAFPNQVANQKYLDDIDQQIAQGTGFPAKAIDQGGDMGYASSVIPMQDLGQLVEDMQNDLSTFIENEFFKPLCKQWNLDFNEVQPEWIFNIFVEKLNFEQLIKIPPTAPLADQELRDAYKEFLPGMDDKVWDEFKKEKEEKQQKMQLQPQGKTADPQNQRPEEEKGAEKPKVNESLHPLLTNPAEFEKYVESLVEKKAKENYFALPPVNGEPYDAPDPEITNPVMLDKVKQMLANVKAGKMDAEELKKEMEKLADDISRVEQWISVIKKERPNLPQDQVVKQALKKATEASNQHGKCVAHFIRDGKEPDQANAICYRDPTANEKSHEHCKSTEHDSIPHQFVPMDEYPQICSVCSLDPADIIHQTPKKTKATGKPKPKKTQMSEP